LAGFSVGKDRTFVLTHSEDPFDASRADQLLSRRESGEPLAYILGWREFFGRKFRVDPSVLIPRHETEILVEQALLVQGVRSVLDVGTGSGCIGITLKLEKPEWNVVCSDFSSAAIQVARENAEILGADVKFRHSDLFARFQGETFDLIVSNPPYIGVEESLPAEVRDHEPHTALFADHHGLEVYERIAQSYQARLNPGGTLILEIGQDQTEPLSRLFPMSQILKDLDGNPRVLVTK
jgi:release factor glutamine methyltransferase